METNQHENIELDSVSTTGIGCMQYARGHNLMLTGTLDLVGINSFQYSLCMKLWSTIMCIAVVGLRASFLHKAAMLEGNSPCVYFVLHVGHDVTIALHHMQNSSVAMGCLTRYAILWSICVANDESTNAQGPHCIHEDDDDDLLYYNDVGSYDNSDVDYDYNDDVDGINSDDTRNSDNNSDGYNDNSADDEDDDGGEEQMEDCNESNSSLLRFILSVFLPTLQYLEQCSIQNSHFLY